MKKNLQTSFQTRQYMLSKDMEIYYYCDTKLKHVESHSHDYYEFYHFLSGNVSMYISGKEYPLSKGDVLLIPPGISHHAVIHDTAVPYRRFVFWISRDFAASLAVQSPDYSYLINCAQQGRYLYPQDMVTASEIQSKIFRLLTEVHTNRFGREAQIQLCICDILLYLNRKVYEQTQPTSLPDSMNLYQSILLYIEEHLDEKLSLDDLAEEFYVSKYYISHLFKKNAGLSLHQYVLKKRLSLCRDAILTNGEITELYHQFGFSDYTCFYRAFCKEYGLSPKKYRELHKEEQKLLKT